ncbi:HalOD1 output domain-containing protein [Natronolimnohabitans innermongolicus]|uniref:Halobacterial output domain-containing protein n=1 Tax=Natronolimnohabitans innermongolicus JCM 12255 TaxID=1227499 RepID=L9XAT0_9EURY|nr:HalOD1 output domain-containing protein [Natronolimnohabitans innermongolicus]ELY57728.1 hypothetical protein C493_07549 [Natronolimnohabitans innermongolicus JCM 12255]
MEHGCYRWEHDAESVAVAVADAVSSVTNVPHDELEPIHDRVDGDALNALVERSDDIRICFEYAGFDVEVRTDEIRLTERP